MAVDIYTPLSMPLILLFLPIPTLFRLLRRFLLLLLLRLLLFFFCVPHHGIDHTACMLIRAHQTALCAFRLFGRPYNYMPLNRICLLFVSSASDQVPLDRP